MEKYLVPAEENPRRPTRLYQWKRSLIELSGRLESKYRHDLSALLLQSYSQIGAFPHLYHTIGGGDAAIPCQTNLNSRGLASDSTRQFAINKQGVSALEFDNKGIYLVSVTKSGCLTVHDFESLYCQANDSFPCFGKDERKCEDESKHVLHNSLGRQLDSVRWNLANQDEVACTSMKTNEVQIFDIGYISSEPVEVLKTRRAVTVHGSDIHKGLTDIAFTSESRLIASDTNGGVNVWDRRMSALPCLELTSNSRGTLNSIKLNVENQMVFGAGRHGIVYMWDLRGGRAPSAFQIHKEMCHPPVMSWKLSSMLERIGSLKAQSDIVSKEVHSIDFDPSCPYQLAFHLDDGWSGILDIYNFQVTHVHCPPPAWLNGSFTDLLSLRKPSWLATHSIYVVGSSTDNGIHLLDFYPDPSSPCHVDYSPIEDAERPSRVNRRNKQNRFIPLSEGVTACAAHPLNGTIIAGTQLSSLLVVSQQKHSEVD
ncbi:hypothetical protein NC651_000242 [Populus alba x Populus x berolinensis]|nr:hypothetical protein NC651_000242 [Populus alba x Populus x berolinensis]